MERILPEEIKERDVLSLDDGEIYLFKSLVDGGGTWEMWHMNKFLCKQGYVSWQEISSLDGEMIIRLSAEDVLILLEEREQQIDSVSQKQKQRLLDFIEEIGY